MARPVTELRFVLRNILGTSPDKVGRILQERTQNSLGEWQDWRDVQTITQEQEEEELRLKQGKEDGSDKN